jgi:hypothetical protein
MYIGGGILGTIVLVVIILFVLGRILTRGARMATQIGPRPRPETMPHERSVAMHQPVVAASYCAHYRQSFPHPANWLQGRWRYRLPRRTREMLYGDTAGVSSLIPALSCRVARQEDAEQSIIASRTFAPLLSRRSKTPKGEDRCSEV